MFRRRNKLEEEVAALRTEVQMLRALLHAGRRVDLVNFGRIKVFMYTDDLAYQGVQEQFRGTPAVNRSFEQAPCRSVCPDEVYADRNSPPLDVIFCHYWRNGLDFAFMDIGCQYGSGAIAIAQFIASCGRDNPVIAFEPGIARGLVPFNIEINRVAGRVIFEPAAVTDGLHPVILFAELGHSENNRVVNRDAAREALSYVVPGTSVDGYVASRGFDQHLILKIDTQGGEYEVLQGMRAVINDRLTTFAMEFTPWALATRCEPAELLGGLSPDYYLLDTQGLELLPGRSKPFRLVAPEAIDAFVGQVDSGPKRHTDVLAIPKRLPGSGDLVRRLLPPC